MVVPRMLPYLNFVLATSSLGVQLGILYPWHIVLDNSFEALKKETRTNLADHIKQHDKQLGRIEGHLEGLVDGLRAGGVKLGPMEPK